jgi:hypothetical protein
MQRCYSVPLVVLLLAGSVCLAQTQSQKAQPARRPPDGGTFERIYSIVIPSLPNAPFTATVNTEWIRPLPDGTTVTWRNRRTIARDAAGRIFQERRSFIPENSNRDSFVMQTEISDPASREFYVCLPREQACRLHEFSRPDFAPPLPVPAGAKGSTVEDLGKQSIGGLETLGARETEVIPTGAVGNNSPILAKREFWYSPQLGVNLVSKREDPRFGTQNFAVASITLGDPDPNLFRPPAGFKIVDLRHPPENTASQAHSPD